MKTKLIDDQNESFLTFHHQQEDTGKTLFIAQVIVSNLLFILLMIHFVSFFQWHNLSLLLYIPGIMINCIFFLTTRRKRTMIISMYFLLVTIIFIVYHSYLVNGIFIIANDLFELIGKTTGTMISPYEVHIQLETYDLAIQIVLAFLGILLALLAYYLVKHYVSLIVWLLFISLFAIQSIIQLQDMLMVNILSACIAIVLSFQSINKKTPTIGSRSEERRVGKESRYERQRYRRTNKDGQNRKNKYGC